MVNRNTPEATPLEFRVNRNRIRPSIVTFLFVMVSIQLETLKGEPMAIVNFAAPILPGKLDAWKPFNASTQGDRKAAMDAIQVAAGVKRQVVSLQ
jgi:hypothetical protein